MSMSVVRERVNTQYTHRDIMKVDLSADSVLDDRVNGYKGVTMMICRDSVACRLR